MAMEIVFKNGDRVEAITKHGTITTDQDKSAPAPFELFMASIGTCAGFYVSKFCRKRKLSTDDMRIVQKMTVDDSTRMITRIELDIELPNDFPEKYRDAVIRAANLCSVKKHLEFPPKIEVRTTTPSVA